MQWNCDGEQTSPRRLLPTIRRARDYHLYDARGKRYLDLYQDGGGAMLGHRPSGFLTRIKNELSRGVLMSAPSPAEGRLKTQLLRQYPGYTHAALVEGAALPGLLADLLEILGQDAAGARRIFDPAVPLGETRRVGDLASPGSAPPVQVALARPFLPVPAAAMLLPLLPVPGFFAVRAVLVRCPEGPKGAAGPAVAVEQRLLREAPPAPATLRAGEMALQGLRRLEEEGAPGWTPDAVAPLWEVRGPYLRFRGGAEVYPEVFRAYREGGYLVSPAFCEPSIVPRIYTEGEFAGFVRLTRRIAETVSTGTGRVGDESTSS